VFKLKQGNCLESLKTLPEKSVQCCVTSPPYFNLRDYGIDGQIGRENSPKEYIVSLVAVFDEVRRVLKDDGVLWVNIGDTWAANRTYQVPSTKGGAKHSPAQGNGGTGSKVPEGMKPKDLIGIPWMLAFALRDAGWYLRQDIIWQKPTAMPESVKDRCVKSHEHVFLLSKSEKYYFNYTAIQEDTQDGGKRSKRDVWTVNTRPIKDAHFAPYPPDLVEPCILSSTKKGDWVIDPFGGSGTTTIVCESLGRNSILLELNPEYIDIAKERIETTQQKGLVK